MKIGCNIIKKKHCITQISYKSLMTTCIHIGYDYPGHKASLTKVFKDA